MTPCKVDGPCPTLCCRQGLTCVRLSAWLHQCQVQYSDRQVSQYKPATPCPAAPPTDTQNCSRVVDAWDPCGGRNTCGQDAACPGTCCKSGYQCVRFDEWYYQCRPTNPEGSSSSPSALVATPPLPIGCTIALRPWEACGGIGTCGQDAPCPGSCCTSGHECLRIDKMYHQCRPTPPKSQVIVSGGNGGSEVTHTGCARVLGANDPCGGIKTCGQDAPCPGTCCSLGYECRRQDQWYYQCLPVPWKNVVIVNQY